MQQKDAKFYFLNNTMITCISITGVPFGSVKILYAFNVHTKFRTFK